MPSITLAKLMRLPAEPELEAFLMAAEDDPGVTEVKEWPYLYQLDDAAEPAVYRFKSE